MSTPSSTGTNTGDRRAPSTTSHFSRGVDVVGQRPWLALVPLVAGLLSLDQLERAARTDVTMQVNFGLPTPVAGVWTFLNAPTESGISVFGYSSTAVANRPELLLTGVGVAGGSLLLVGLLTAVYLGSIDDALAGRSGDPVENLRRYAPVTLAFAALQFCFLLVLLVLGGGLFAAGPGAAAALFVPVFIVALAGYYLLTPGVFVGVAADLDPVPAFRRGARVALSADYVVFALAYAALVAVCSVPLSAFAFTAGLPTILTTALVAAPLGLALNAATMAFVRHRVGEASDGTHPPSDDGPDPGRYDEKGDGIDGIVMGMGTEEDGEQTDNTDTERNGE